MFRNLICVVAAALSLVACAADTAAIKKLPPGRTLGAADPATPLVTAEYRLWPNDVVQIDVFNMPQLSRSAQLDSAGNIEVALLGQVHAGGQTATELAQKIQAAYGDKYLQNPQVSILVKQSKVDNITVDGSVQSPGVFQISQSTTLVHAIALARGLDQMANPKQIVVFRNVNSQRVAGVFDLEQIRSGQAPDPMIYPNDEIIVASSATRRTLRDIIGVTPLVTLLPLIP